MLHLIWVNRQHSTSRFGDEGPESPDAGELTSPSQP
jgi:hypothetical protein